ncbi:UNVERIFIED_CONTAM: hypothetical protein Slati_4257300 [Sesamum latifolium]|uniref:Uncharacterized protein n=1 Tax=Sesamum latifolium TaxID=2727402 RepID=A0AAW2TCW0_9LAMI
MSASFNVTDLSPFYADANSDSRSNPSKEEGNDRNHQKLPTQRKEDPLKINGGPIKRARTKKINQVLMILIDEANGTMREETSKEHLVMNILQVDGP